MLSSPVTLAIWGRIKLDRDGPAVYAGRRVGRGGREFRMYKFRTMVTNADKVGGPSTPDDDPRLTRTGRLLRRYKLDELPQLVNVLKGDMSFVGPRPQVPDEVAGYTAEEREILSVRPGITDWSSLRFHNEGEILAGHADPDRAYAELIRPEKMRLGLEYVRRGTFRDDIDILAQTFLLPVRKQEATTPSGGALRAAPTSPQGGEARDYTTVTETWGLPASPEQLAMQYFRYRMAAELVPGGAVLEVGCGSGMGLPYLQAHSKLVVGGDYTMALLMEARRHLPDANLVRLDAQRIPFGDHSFDAVLMLEMIYYVVDQEAAFAECRRVLKPGGKLMVCMPNRERPDFNPSPFSTRYPDLREIATLLTKAGFEARVYGGFVVEAASSRGRILGPIRHVAVRYRLIPSSMRAKSMIKRMLYGRMPALGAVHDGMAEHTVAVELDPSAGSDHRFKNLYAVGVAPR